MNINLNKLIADDYDKIGDAKVNELFFGPKDHTHTILEGAKFNAAKVAEGVGAIKGLALAKYLK